MQPKRDTTMKIKIIALICFAFTAGAATAQTGNVSFPSRNVSIKEAFGEITKQAGYLFAFNHTLLDDSKIVALTKQNLTVTEALSELLKGTGSKYEVKGNHILIVALPQPPKPSPQPRQTTPPARHTGNEWEWDWTSSRTERQRETTKNDNETVVKKVVVVEKIVADKVEVIAEEKAETTSKPVIQSSTPVIPVVDTPQPEHQSQPQANASPVTKVIVEKNRSGIRSQRYDMKRPAVLSLKTNLLYGGVTFTPNLSLELGLGNRTSLDIWGGYNPLVLDDSPTLPKKLEHWIVRPEFRYWLRERSSGHFFGIHGFYSEYDVVGVEVPMIFDKEFQYVGNVYGGGITYGYHLMIGKHWGMEFNVSAGAGNFEYDKIPRGKDNNVGKFSKTYVGPTGAGIKLVFIIK